MTEKDIEFRRKVLSEYRKEVEELLQKSDEICCQGLDSNEKLIKPIRDKYLAKAQRGPDTND